MLGAFWFLIVTKYFWNEHGMGGPVTHVVETTTECRFLR